jgi:acetate CoA/acetoacetate CoA-transferase beta subunit
MVPGKMVPGMGGAMDLVTGARHVIIAMEHCTKDGGSKILKECNLPLTCKGKVHLIVTEKAVFRVEDCLMLEELGPGMTIEDVRKCTEADFKVSPSCKQMSI